MAQLEVARHREGPMLVLGAAGTGRSEALSLRLASLVGAGKSACTTRRRVLANVGV